MPSKYLKFRGATYKLADGLDTHAVRELGLFLDGEEPLYNSKMRMFVNLATKVARGIYDREKAVKLFEYLVKEAVRMYGGPTETVAFDRAVRRAVAEELRDEFEAYLKTEAQFLRPEMPKKYRDAPLKL